MINKINNNIFVYGYYGCGNLGDQLLLEACISKILEFNPTAIFYVRNLGKLEASPELLNSIIETNIERILVDNSKSRPLRYFKYMIASNKILKSTKIFLLGGGTLIHASVSNSSLILLLSLITLAKVHGNKIIAVGLGAMDLDRPFSKLIAKLIINQLDFGGIRDKNSLKLLNNPKRCIPTSDLVFSWWKSSYYFNNEKASNIISISLWSIPPLDSDKILVLIADALNKVITSNTQIRLIVLQHAGRESGGLSDIEAFEKLKSLVKNKDIEFTTIFPLATQNSLIEAFSDTALHIGARYHACVASAVLGIPFIGIATEPKITSLCEIYGMPVIDIKTSNHKILSDTLENIHNIKIDKIITKMQILLSELNFSWLRDHDL